MKILNGYKVYLEKLEGIKRNYKKNGEYFLVLKKNFKNKDVEILRPSKNEATLYIEGLGFNIIPTLKKYRKIFKRDTPAGRIINKNILGDLCVHLDIDEIFEMIEIEKDQVREKIKELEGAEK